MSLNVPMNQALDDANPASVAGTELWRNYLRRWTAWNHVRTVAGAIATALLVLSLV